ncbi:phosphogluconate dehydrogenase (NAD(+)-dependent, decarboxylating) [Naumannella cuiyingiana]|uniref:6-phosphogluconate dehydrogenase n=1 Tax=Naumannella cuiyingiana TaxID=1347891 RepID=A0A7Z0IL03_9ACTN|nr:decarboxylating 6-phosphogluconate dehydrogenase [Naumannella cuiyingiana]NYI71058.1 6-phosphogluconate dehydrogenase [Naumannella cuiyingiana]
MKMGLIGLGKMGGNMRQRLRNAGIEVVGYDRDPALTDAADLADLVGQLGDSPRIVWVMLPIQAVPETLATLKELLGEGDVVIDGGNSKWTHDVPNAELLAEKGIGYLDVGVSGGVWGLENGYALMVGGSKENVAKALPIFEALKPEGPYGYVHAGGVGAGHFAKMVHNGIEYGIMQSYAEGWELLTAASAVDDVPAVFESWQEGTVIKSWLLELCVRAMQEDPNLDHIRGYAEDSGEGRWTVEAGIDLAVPTPAITASLYARFVSRQEDSPAMKLVAAMRNQFGGHKVLAEDENSRDDASDRLGEGAAGRAKA